ncbi:MAG: hypothetical protein ACOH5I_09745 [Oligoflexus sp.]
MKINSLAFLVAILGLTVACQQGVEYQPQQQRTSAANAVPGVGEDENGDHTTKEEEALASEEPAPVDEEAEPVEQAPPPGSTELSQADILKLDMVQVRGSGDLEEGSADFAKRYTDPNGKPLNDQANLLTLRQGQTLQVCNDGANENLRIHTNGEPFPHGGNIAPGACTNYALNDVVVGNGNNIYDHNLGGNNNNRVYSIYITVITDAEAQQIIAAAGQ